MGQTPSATACQNALGERPVRLRKNRERIDVALTNRSSTGLPISPIRLPIYVAILVDTEQHSTAPRVASALLRPDISASGNTAGRSCSPSQGGSTGSNPVRAAKKDQVRATLRGGSPDFLDSPSHTAALGFGDHRRQRRLHFVVDASTPWFPDSVSRSFKRLCAKEGVPDVRLHDLRHFVATQLLSAGVDVRTVAGRLGHRNAATTLNVYAQFVEQADQGAADVMGGVLNDGNGRSPDDSTGAS